MRHCREFGGREFRGSDFDIAMCIAAGNDHVEIVKQCKEWGCTDFNQAMGIAA